MTTDELENEITRLRALLSNTENKLEETTRRNVRLFERLRYAESVLRPMALQLGELVGEPVDAVGEEA